MLCFSSSEWVGDRAVPSSQRAPNPNYPRQRDGRRRLALNSTVSHSQCAVSFDTAARHFEPLFFASFIHVCSIPLNSTCIV